MDSHQVKIKTAKLVEVPTLYRSTSVSSCVGSSDSTEDLYFEITSFDDSCIQRSCSKSNNIKIFDTSSDISVNCVENFSSLVESNHVQVSGSDSKMNTKKYYHKSLLSMIKILKSFSVRHNSNNNNSYNNNNNNNNSNNNNSNNKKKSSILRKPQEYVYIKGISGLSNRVPTTSLKTTICQRCYVRSG
jgi:hypothetical protein